MVLLAGVVMASAEKQRHFDDHLDGILGTPVSSDDYHDVHPHKSDRHDDQHGHDHHDDHHNKEWSKPSKSKKKDEPPCGDDTCGNAEKLTEIYTVFWYHYFMPTLIAVVQGGALYLTGVSIFTKVYEVYLRVWEGHPPA